VLVSLLRRHKRRLLPLRHQRNPARSRTASHLQGPAAAFPRTILDPDPRKWWRGMSTRSTSSQRTRAQLIRVRPGPSVYATFVYMSETVGVAELRQNLSRFLQRVALGERLVVTDHNRPVAGSALDRLVIEGRVARPARRRLPEPLQLDGNPYALSRALDEIRGER
jgi:antitoxin (DNA-binding transcriptional repressor) of toxin-antitoxin stability system